MSDNNYNPNSVNAVLSRIETKIDEIHSAQESQRSEINKIWAALGRLDVRVAMIATLVSGAGFVLKLVFGK